MRNYAEETEKRVQYIRQAVADAHADGILFGNSGGKDSALVRRPRFSPEVSSSKR